MAAAGSDAESEQPGWALLPLKGGVRLHLINHHGGRRKARRGRSKSGLREQDETGPAIAMMVMAVGQAIGLPFFLFAVDIMVGVMRLFHSQSA